MILPFALEFSRPVWLWLLLLLPVFIGLAFLLGRKRTIPPRDIWLRAVTLGLLVVALAQPLWSMGAAAPATVIAVDRSASVAGPTSATIAGWLDDALAAAGSHDRAAIVTFGGNARLSQPISTANDLHTNFGDDQLDTDSTDIANALSVAGVLPAGDGRRIVLISDGAETNGSALEQAAQNAADGIPIDVLPVEGIGTRDLRIANVTTSNTLWQGESLTVQVGVMSSEDGNGQIGLLVDGEEIATQAVEFQPGANNYTFTIDDLAPGFHRMELMVDPGATYDVTAENNRREFGVVVRDAPHLLFVEPEGVSESPLPAALDRQGMQITLVHPADIPERLSELAIYDAIVLNNISAESLSLDQIATLDQSTRAFGRGLIVIGGASAYGPGAYANTPLEDLLPVDVKVTEGKERQRIALLLVIDKSGSMATGPGGSVPKIDMAKEAAQLAATALLDGDEIAILAFNDRQQWIVRLTKIEGQGDRNRIDTAVEELRADGGTEIYPALDVGFDELSKSDAEVRHIVLLSDGRSSTGSRESYTGLVERMRQMGTTLSTIGIGNDADTELLQYLASLGRGRYHMAAAPEDIPRLTVQEAQAAGSQSIVRGDFQPIQIAPSAIMTGIDPAGLPTLSGYDYVELKTGARSILTSDRDDPVLSTWQYGLGRVVAWTADDGIDFARAWSDWDGYIDFWTRVTQWALPDPNRGAVEVTSERSGSDVLITLSMPSNGVDSIDIEHTMIDIIGPDGDRADGVVPYRSAPGEWQLRIANPQAGAYQLEIGAGSGAGTLASFTLAASPELEPAPDSQSLLRQLAERTGGRVLSLDDPSALFDVPMGSGAGLRSYRPIWVLPAGLALALVTTELALRYQALDRLRRLRSTG